MTDTDRPAIERSARAAPRYEQLSFQGIEDHRQPNPPPPLVGNRDTELGKTVSEVGSTVERIDNPSMLTPPRVRTALFGEDRVVRESAAERPDGRLFRFPIGLGKEIDRVGLAGDLDAA